MRMRWYHAVTNVRRQKVMVWLGACSSLDLTPLVMLDEGTVDYSCYIKNVLSVALKYWNEVFGDNCVFQQGGAKPHRDHLIQE